MKEEKENLPSVAANEMGGLRRVCTSLDSCLVIWRGERELTVHGCSRILLYSNEQIRLQMKRKSLSVRGRGLCCSSFSAGVMVLEGEICSVCYETGEGGDPT